jgi:hypothetical protein
MKSMKSIAVTVVAIAALWTAGPASAAGRGGHAAAGVRGVGSTNHFAATGNGAWMRQHNNNRRFATSFGFPSGYGGYGYGNTVYQNPDEADWAEQWQSLYEDNHGAYAKSTRENPQGGARMWTFPEEQGQQGTVSVTDEH